ncbi:C1 family peptidase [Nonomuraea sp. NPDC050404]|uniref:aminopeptidase C n=1 Tax=Nonomuraea sp. NPDC050404 TaxID=3155783 RepID=UPI0033E5AFF9
MSSISPSDLAAFARRFAADPQLKRMQNAIANVSVDQVALDHSVAVGVGPTMSHRIDDWKATDQKKTGRCWLFAALNLMRPGTADRLGVKDFEFSQAHAMYWDKLERANYFLESIIATAERPIDDRIVAFLLGMPVNDGGQWNMAVSVFAKHGVVPKSVMPETQSSSDSAKMNRRLRVALRHGAKRLRELSAAGAADRLREVKTEVLAEVHTILNIHLGTPPDSFTWEWTDRDKQFHSDGELTPQEFMARYVELDLSAYVCLVDDPRPEHPKNATLTVEHLGNVIEGDPVLYLNVDIATAKRLAMETIVDGEPVWFGCDTGQQSDGELGIWDARLYDYDGVYGTRHDLDKEARVRYHDSLMTHAMLFTGVHVVDGAPRRWRVENSWGTKKGDGGFYTMNDSWFDEYVFEVVVRKDRLSPELLAALDTAPLVLPAWDPMGALA